MSFALTRRAIPEVVGGVEYLVLLRRVLQECLGFLEGCYGGLEGLEVAVQQADVDVDGSLIRLCLADLIQHLYGFLPDAIILFPEGILEIGLEVRGVARVGLAEEFGRLVQIACGLCGEGVVEV